MRILGLLMLGAAIIGCAACTTAPAGVTCSTLPITSKDSYTVVAKDVYATDWGIGFFSWSFIPYSAYHALQKAKASNGADGLINVTCENKQYWLLGIMPLITYQFIKLHGDAIKLKRGAGEK